jgi:hypothetical protein
VAQGGSGGGNGCVGARGIGGNYGGGGGTSNGLGAFTLLGSGAIRIVWPGTTRQFPSTLVNY